MVSKTLMARLRALEAAQGGGPMQIMNVDAIPSSEQLKDIAEAERTGRRLVVLVAKGDTAWMPGAGRPPWELPEGADVDTFI